MYFLLFIFSNSNTIFGSKFKLEKNWIMSDYTFINYSRFYYSYIIIIEEKLFTIISYKFSYKNIRLLMNNGKTEFYYRNTGSRWLSILVASVIRSQVSSNILVFRPTFTWIHSAWQSDQRYLQNDVVELHLTATRICGIFDQPSEEKMAIWLSNVILETYENQQILWPQTGCFQF